MFAFRGVVQPVKSLSDLGGVLAAHPLVAAGWVERLCYYANSSACDASDPLFLKIVGDFQSSGFAWNPLVKELLSSPIVTHASATQTARTVGEVVAVSRRDHMCAALDARLGFTDVCGLLASSGKATTTIPQIVSGLPSDAYGRGAVAPILPNQPTLFFRAATENICEGIAAQIIDVPSARRLPGTVQWSSAQPDAAISEFVGLVMGLTPSDPRAAPATALLKSHFTSAMAQSGVTATQALQSTFVTACVAPSAVSIGM
jgi:hypothetical protein